MGQAAYRRENAALRDAARRFSPVRDAQVGLQTVAVLLKSEDHPRVRLRLAALRRELAAQRKRARPGGAALREVITALEKSAARIARLKVPADTGPMLYAGLARVYRRGRKALRAALADGGDEALHEARKQAKYLEAGLALLPKAARPQKARRRAARVADGLGADHDLAVLEQRAGLSFTARRGKLQKKAFERARRLYRRTPARLGKRLG